ncbi:MAG: dihydrodipicolinate synthase family protein [Amaricoccus sp.]
MPRYPRTVLGTCCLPWRDGRLDRALFERSIRRLVHDGLRDLYVFGTAGEGHAVTEAQFREVTQLFVETLADADGAPPMVGVIALSLPTVLERIAFAAKLGVETFQFCLPSWGAIGDGEVRRVFAEVCGGFPDRRFLHYNLGRTGRLVRPEEYAELAERHPNLVAIKYGLGDPETIAGLLRLAPQLRCFFTEPGFYIGAPLGECGLLASISSSNPGRAREYFEAGVGGDWTRFAELYRELAGIMGAVREAAGGVGLTDGAYDKLVSKLANQDFPLYLLPPYQAATEEGFAHYRATLQARYPHWLPPAERVLGK